VETTALSLCCRATSIQADRNALLRRQIVRRSISRVLSKGCPFVRPFIWDASRLTPLATYPDTPTHKRAVICANANNMVSLFGLAPGGACHAPFLTVGAVSSYLAVSPLPITRIGGLFSVALSLKPCYKARPRRELPATMFAWSPDFPPLRPFGASFRSPPFGGMQARSPDRLTGSYWAARMVDARAQQHVRSVTRFQHQ
jgi:hypothetical protein